MKKIQEQIVLINKSKLNKITNEYLYASSINEVPRSPKTMYKLQRLGVRCGVPSLHLPYPNKKYHSLFIQLKRKEPEKGKLTDSQQTWINRLNKAGNLAVVAYGWEEAWQIIQDYLTQTGA